MEEESFEDGEIAEILNQNFVAIKVDREERPDVDEIYMKSVQTMTRQGGWPLSVFLTPDLKPFYGGTYFPPAPSHGLPSFSQVLKSVADLWREKKGEVEKSAEQITQLLRESYAVRPRGGVSEDALDFGYASLLSSYDPEYGGYGGPPKFPLPTYLNFLLRYYVRTRKELALKSVVKTLTSVANGGIRDHVGGGFHRYSTDRRWLVPHFEKMLYDNALLARAYLEAYQLTHDSFFAATVRDVFGWISHEMTDAQGGVYSAQDADTEGGEGVYYTWKQEEIKSVLGERDAEIFSHHYGVTPRGNFEDGGSILHVVSSLENTASRFALTLSELEELLQRSKEKLLEIRLKRQRPSVDDKILTSWNGLAISALAYGYQVLGDDVLLEAARRSAEFISNNLLRDDRLYRRYRDGDVDIEGTLEDYSFFVAGLLDLYEAGFEVRWLEQAINLTKQMIDLFCDNENGGFFFNSSRERLPAEIKEAYDGPTPSGNSVAALNLLRVGEFTGDQEFKRKAEAIFNVFSERLEAEPSSHTFMLTALDFFFSAPKEIVLASRKDVPDTKAIVREMHTRFMPNKVLLQVSDENSTELQRLSPLIEGKVVIGGKPTVYICEQFACKMPINDLETLRKQLS